MDVRLMVHHVIDPVRNQLALPCRAKVVIERFDGLGGEGRPYTVKVPKQLLLFRIDRNHRIAGRFILASQAGDVFKLCVSSGVVTHRLFLARRAAAHLEVPQQSTNRAAAGRRASCQQPPRQLAQRPVRPQHAFAHRIASRELLQQGAEVRFQGRLRHYARRAAPPFVRMRPAARSSVASRSRRPCRMGLGSHAQTRAMSSTPPWPSLAASTAAYRRRSFSDNHPKKRCIFSSISAEYPSMLYSLSQNLLWRKDTTAQACREVILDHILNTTSLDPPG